MMRVEWAFHNVDDTDSGETFIKVSLNELSLFILKMPTSSDTIFVNHCFSCICALTFEAAHKKNEECFGLPPLQPF